MYIINHQVVQMECWGWTSHFLNIFVTSSLAHAKMTLLLAIEPHSHMEGLRRLQGRENYLSTNLCLPSFTYTHTQDLKPKYFSKIDLVSFDTDAHEVQPRAIANLSFATALRRRADLQHTHGTLPEPPIPRNIHPVVEQALGITSKGIMQLVQCFFAGE